MTNLTVSDCCARIVVRIVPSSSSVAPHPRLLRAPNSSDAAAAATGPSSVGPSLHTARRVATISDRALTAALALCRAIEVRRRKRPSPCGDEASMHHRQYTCVSAWEPKVTSSWLFCQNADVPWSERKLPLSEI